MTLGRLDTDSTTDIPQTPEVAEAPPPVPEERGTQRQYVLKDADSFIVTDANGDIGGTGDGLFCNDTRLLSKLQLRLGPAPPALLSVSVSRDNVFLTVHGTNRPLPPLGGRNTPEGVIHLERSRFLWGNRLYERVQLRNFGRHEALVPLRLSFDADFRDMFEVRGVERSHRGRQLPAQATAQSLRFRYEGLDGVLRVTQVAFSEAPLSIEGGDVRFEPRLPPGGTHELFIEIGGVELDTPPSRERYRTAAARARRAMRRRRREGGRLHSNSRLFNEWIEKSRADLALLTSELPTGPYPYAGIPWFSTPFGRDAIVTALQTLWLDTRLARGVLTYLAHHQAQHWSSFQDSAPGKIMHETRKGEMSNLRELPFAQYYGGVDTTPLFVLLAGAYVARTGDLKLINQLWPSLKAAMQWIETVCDAHPLGLLDYARGETSGLANQGWKDSEDSVFHHDGRLAEGPIALVEVQGYVYAAFHEMSLLAQMRGDSDAAHRWGLRMRAICSTVESHYWMEGPGTYGIALDGRNQLCRISSTNPGHLLFTGLPEKKRARRVIENLLSPRMNAGWGLRTVASGQARFNPMAYHNGSIWPHDTALCAAGMARYGERDGVVRLLDGLFEAAVHFGMRLPELFCGFARKPGEPPIAYPVACLPQAWAAGSLFMLLQSCLGLQIDGFNDEIRIDKPRLPTGIDRLLLQDLIVGHETVSLVFQRVGDRVAVFREPGSGTGARIVCSV